MVEKMAVAARTCPSKEEAGDYIHRTKGVHCSGAGCLGLEGSVG